MPELRRTYKSTAEELYYPYVRPQENGHHTDTRWLALTTDKGNGLLIKADSTIGFNALRNAIEDFDSEEALPHDYQWSNFTPEEIANAYVDEQDHYSNGIAHYIECREGYDRMLDLESFGGKIVIRKMS